MMNYSKHSFFSLNDFTSYAFFWMLLPFGNTYLSAEKQEFTSTAALMRWWLVTSRRSVEAVLVGVVEQSK
jgi:succinate-acetate transporter protein